MLLAIPKAAKHASGAAAGPIRDRRIQRAHLISQELFRDALVRERKRADRFEEAFVVLLITLDRRRLDKKALQRLTEAMLQAQTGADVIGWFERDVVLGLIRSVAPVDLEDAATTLADAVRREVDAQLDALPGRRVRVSLRDLLLAERRRLAGDSRPGQLTAQTASPGAHRRQARVGSIWKPRVPHRLRSGLPRRRGGRETDLQRARPLSATARRPGPDVRS